jgi:hypothetical protein
MIHKAYDISSYWDGDVLTIVITGQLLRGNAKEIARDVIAVTNAHKPQKTLINCLELVGRLSTADTYYHVRNYPSERYPVPRVAILDKEENKNYYSFHETTANNVGIYIKYYNNSDEAMQWLRQ